MPSFSITGLNVTARTKSSPASASQAAARMSRAAAIKRALGRTSDQRELGLRSRARLKDQARWAQAEDAVSVEVSLRGVGLATNHQCDLDRIYKSPRLLLPVDASSRCRIPNGVPLEPDSRGPSPHLIVDFDIEPAVHEAEACVFLVVRDAILPREVGLLRGCRGRNVEPDVAGIGLSAGISGPCRIHIRDDEDVIELASCSGKHDIVPTSETVTS